MEYHPVNEVLQSLVACLAALERPGEPGVPLLPEVRAVRLSGYENLFRLLPELTVFPAAVVTAGSHAFRQSAAARELEVAVLLIDEFHVDAEAATAGFDLQDRIVDCLTGSQPARPLQLAGVHFLLENVLPLELDSAHVAWQYNLRATAGFLRPGILS